MLIINSYTYIVDDDSAFGFKYLVNLILPSFLKLPFLLRCVGKQCSNDIVLTNLNQFSLLSCRQCYLLFSLLSCRYT